MTFASSFQNYGEDSCTANAHLLLHLRKCSVTFASSFQNYGEDSCTANAHLLLHLTKYVHLWAVMSRTAITYIITPKVFTMEELALINGVEHITFLTGPFNYLLDCALVMRY